ncbi:6976_t:CDS:2 [Entrophospora sp. SA101]|nr:6976_t:CDS:2 [Entrophospora sp. SA101]
MAISESLLDENEELNGQPHKDVMNVFVEELDLGIGWIVHYSMKHKRFDAQDACGISHASVPIAITVGAIEKYSLGLVQCELSGTNLSPSLVACAVALKISAIGNLSKEIDYIKDL